MTAYLDSMQAVAYTSIIVVVGSGYVCLVCGDKKLIGNVVVLSTQLFACRLPARHYCLAS